MERQEIFTKVHRVFCEVMENEELVITESTTAEDVEEWTSLTHVSLITKLQSEFGIKFKLGEIMSMKSIGDMISAIASKL